MIVFMTFCVNGTYCPSNQKSNVNLLFQMMVISDYIDMDNKILTIALHLPIGLLLPH